MSCDNEGRGSSQIFGRWQTLSPGFWREQKRSGKIHVLQLKVSESEVLSVRLCRTCEISNMTKDTAGVGGRRERVAAKLLSSSFNTVYGRKETTAGKVNIETKHPYLSCVSWSAILTEILVFFWKEAAIAVCCSIWLSCLCCFLI